MKKTLEEVRENYIRKLDDIKTNNIDVNLNFYDTLFNLDLTFYVNNNSLESIIYNIYSQSKINPKISLHPKQIEILNLLEKNNALILSAPTSFGKTFTIFEHIWRTQPKKIIVIVPTVALINEYKDNLFKYNFNKYYKIYSYIDQDVNLLEIERYICVLTQERLMEFTNISNLKEIDLFVIDEAYKLSLTNSDNSSNDDRVITLNYIFYVLVKITKKYILLLPFIRGVENINELPMQPYFYHTNFSPVVNDVEIVDVNRNNKFEKCIDIVNKLNGEKTLIYFATPSQIINFSKELFKSYTQKVILDNDINELLLWIEGNISEDWYIINVLKIGFGVHCGSLPIGIRNVMLHFYQNNKINNLLCTSTLLEGVNTITKNLIITSPKRSNYDFSDFDFFNLVGRTARLNKYYIGKTYYLKENKNKNYDKENAKILIEFEITNNSIDSNIIKQNKPNDLEFNNFLEKLNINFDEYINIFGSKKIFKNINKILINFNESNLLSLIDDYLISNDYKIIIEIHKKIYDIFNNSDKNKEYNKRFLFIIEIILNNPEYSIKKIFDISFKYLSDINPNIVLDNILKFRLQQIEFDIYPNLKILINIMEKMNIEVKYINFMMEKFLNKIEHALFINSKHKKMLTEMGIYYSDIDYISSIIGKKYNNLSELYELIIDKYSDINKEKISYITKFILIQITKNKILEE